MQDNPIMIYLNNAATSYPKPPEVIEAVNSCLASIPFHSSRTGFEIQSEDLVYSCRERLASLFNIQDPNNIIFTSGSTESINMALYGLNLEGCHVVTTAMEHNSVLRPLKTMEKEKKITLSIAPCDKNGYVKPDTIAGEIRRNTKVIIVNHCSNVTGEILDLNAISQIAHARDIVFIVDASQSAGSVPVDIVESGADIAAFTGHKSLYGIPGIGALYIKEDLNLKPLKVGGTGVRSDLLLQPEVRPIYYEAGTQNLPGIASLDAGVRFILKTGIEKIRERKSLLIEKIISEFEKNNNIIIYGRKDTDNRAAILCFNIRGMSPDDIGYVLENSFGIIIRSGLHCAPLIHKALGSYPEGSIRVSPSFFTPTEDIESLVNAVKEISKAKAVV